MFKVLSLVIALVVVCTEGYIVDLSSGMDVVGATHHQAPQAQDLVKSLFRRDTDMNKAKRNCQRCLNGIYCKEMKRCKICQKMCKDAGIPMPKMDASNSTATPTATITPSTPVETTEFVTAEEVPIELEQRFGNEPVVVGEPEESFVKNQKDLEPETLNDQTMVTSGAKDGKAFRLEPEFYTVGSFGPGPVKDLMERLLNIDDDQAGRIIRLVVIAQTKTTYQDEQAVILDSVHAFDRHVPIIVSVSKGHPRQLAFEDNSKKPSVTRDQLETIIDQVMKELKDSPQVLPESVAPKAASNEIMDDEETEKKPPGPFHDYDIDDNGEGRPMTTPPARPAVMFNEGQAAAPLSSGDQIKESQDFGNAEINEVSSREARFSKEGLSDNIQREETIPKETSPAERIIPEAVQNPEVGIPEQTSNTRGNLEDSIIDVVKNSLKELDSNSRLEEANPADTMRRMERPLEEMEQIMEPVQNIERVEGTEQRPIETAEPVEGMEPVADQRPVQGMEQRFEEQPLKTMKANGPTTKTFAIPQEPQSDVAQVTTAAPLPDAEFEQKVHELVTPKIHVKDLPSEFPADIQSRMNDEAESSEQFDKFGELVPRDGQGNVFFIGKDIKLPLKMTKDESGRVTMTVDMDRLCSCKNQTCPRPHLEELMPQVRHQRSLEPDFVNSIEHVIAADKKDEDEDELVKLNEEYQFRQLEEKLEDKLDKLNKDVEKYNDENETLLNKGTLALFKNVEKAKNVEKTIDLVNNVLSWMKNLTVHHAAS